MNFEEVKDFVYEKSIEAEIVASGPGSARTSALAAKQHGCTVVEVEKTIVFSCKVKVKEVCILALLSGDKRVNPYKLSGKVWASGAIIMDAEEVNETTYTIGTMLNFPNLEGLKVFVDRSLMRFSKVLGATGATNALMRFSPITLLEQLA